MRSLGSRRRMKCGCGLGTKSEDAYGSSGECLGRHAMMLERGVPSASLGAGSSTCSARFRSPHFAQDDTVIESHTPRMTEQVWFPAEGAENAILTEKNDTVHIVRSWTCLCFESVKQPKGQSRGIVLTFWFRFRLYPCNGEVISLVEDLATGRNMPADSFVVAIPVGDTARRHSGDDRGKPDPERHREGRIGSAGQPHRRHESDPRGAAGEPCGLRGAGAPLRSLRCCGWRCT